MAGYIVALGGVFYYNYQKFLAAQSAQSKEGQELQKGKSSLGGTPTQEGDSVKQKDQEEAAPLLKKESESSKV
jgi:hypothetical protein